MDSTTSGTKRASSESNASTLATPSKKTKTSADAPSGLFLDTVYVLPDGYEVTEASLNDIKFVLRPTFTKAQVEELDKSNKYSYDLNNKRYLPGFVGLNNVKANDYVNVIIQAFAHVRPLRDHFLLQPTESNSELVQRTAMLIRKMWNPRAFKGQVSPHELLQEISNTSQKKFRLAEQSDPVEFLSWFFNAMHQGLGGTRKRGSSIIHQIFQGELVVESQTLIPSVDEDSDKKKVFDMDRDLPPPPLFQDELEKNIIPQVPLSQLLSKYDGVTAQEIGRQLKRYKISKLPPYLIFHIKRFTKNNWAMEKNPTIVNFPIVNVDMKDFLENLSQAGETRYDLVANICHEGKPGAGNGTYKVHVHGKGNDQWFSIQDLIVEEIMPQMIFLSESYVQPVQDSAQDHLPDDSTHNTMEENCPDLNAKTSEEPTEISKLPRKERIKLKKKARRRASRQDLAKERQRILREKAQDANLAAAKALKEELEAKQREEARLLWEIREQQIERENALKRAEREKLEAEERRKEEVKRNWEKALEALNEKQAKQKTFADRFSRGASIAAALAGISGALNANPTSIPNLQQTTQVTATDASVAGSTSNSAGASTGSDSAPVATQNPIPLQTPSASSAAPATNEPTNSQQKAKKDAMICTFYLKMGVCKFGDKCTRTHLVPVTSCTLLIKHMYESPRKEEDAGDKGLEVNDEDYKHFCQFYADVYPEFEKFGKILQFKVGENPFGYGIVARHSLKVEFCPVTDWRSAVCGLYERKMCPRGLACPYLHVFRNPGDVGISNSVRPPTRPAVSEAADKWTMDVRKSYTQSITDKRPERNASSRNDSGRESRSSRSEVETEVKVEIQFKIKVTIKVEITQSQKIAEENFVGAEFWLVVVVKFGFKSL
ncbi:hypothetical protein HK102_001116 [Quaeritorhiza haematococci]|nr:hypothetical protein HK102_001116 [Quaeritorhiza haematococci]